MHPLISACARLRLRACCGCSEPPPFLQPSPCCPSTPSPLCCVVSSSPQIAITSMYLGRVDVSSDYLRRAAAACCFYPGLVPKLAYCFSRRREADER